MKKHIYLSLFVSLITLSNVACTPENNDKPAQKQTSLSQRAKKLEIAKITGAAAGSAFLGCAAALMPAFLKNYGTDDASKFYFRPSLLMTYPVSLLDPVIDRILKKVLSKENGEDVSNAIMTKLPYAAALVSFAGSCYLAKYAFTKFRQLRNKNSKAPQK